MQDRPVAAGDRAQLDVHDVVAEPAAVREAREVAVEDAEAVAGCAGVGGIARVQAELVGRRRPGEVERPGRRSAAPRPGRCGRLVGASASAG